MSKRRLDALPMGSRRSSPKRARRDDSMMFTEVEAPPALAGGDGAPPATGTTRSPSWRSGGAESLSISPPAADRAAKRPRSRGVAMLSSAAKRRRRAGALPPTPTSDTDELSSSAELPLQLPLSSAGRCVSAHATSAPSSSLSPPSTVVTAAAAAAAGGSGGGAKQSPWSITRHMQRMALMEPIDEALASPSDVGAGTDAAHPITSSPPRRMCTGSAATPQLEVPLGASHRVVRNRYFDVNSELRELAISRRSRSEGRLSSVRSSSSSSSSRAGSGSGSSNTTAAATTSCSAASTSLLSPPLINRASFRIATPSGGGTPAAAALRRARMAHFASLRIASSGDGVSSVP